MLTDYDKILNLLDQRGLKFDTDWNKEAMFNNETRLIKWITVRSIDETGKIVYVDFKFSQDGVLESVCPFTNS
jgi:hypothetical protein